MLDPLLTDGEDFVGGKPSQPNPADQRRSPPLNAAGMAGPIRPWRPALGPEISQPSHELVGRHREEGKRRATFPDGASDPRLS